jgi:hypothetical protein
MVNFDANRVRCEFIDEIDKFKIVIRHVSTCASSYRQVLIELS